MAAELKRPAPVEAEDAEDDYEEEEEEDASSYESDEAPKAKAGGGSKKKTVAKKPRGAPPALDKLLAPLDSSTLSTLLVQVCARTAAQQASVSNEQFVRQQLAGALSLAAVDTRLAAAEATFKKIGPAFPHTRYGSSRDHFCYKRVRPVQAIFIKAVAEPLTDLKEAKNWQAMLRYLAGAVRLALDLPHWDDAADNKPRIALYKRLAANLRAALKSEAGKALSAAERQTWATLLGDVSEFEDCAELVA